MSEIGEVSYSLVLTNFPFSLNSAVPVLGLYFGEVRSHTTSGNSTPVGGDGKSANFVFFGKANITTLITKGTKNKIN